MTEKLITEPKSIVTLKAYRGGSNVEVWAVEKPEVLVARRADAIAGRGNSTAGMVKVTTIVALLPREIRTTPDNIITVEAYD